MNAGNAVLIPAAISTVGIIAAAVIARWTGRGGKRLTEAQRDSLTVQTAERVVAMQEVERRQLTERVKTLEDEIVTLKLRYAERERDLESARGEATALRAEVGTLRATLAAREAELAAAKAMLSTLTPTASAEGLSAA